MGGGGGSLMLGYSRACSRDAVRGSTGWGRNSASAWSGSLPACLVSDAVVGLAVQRATEVRVREVGVRLALGAPRGVVGDVPVCKGGGEGAWDGSSTRPALQASHARKKFAFIVDMLSSVASGGKACGMHLSGSCLRVR